eukprot:1160860-Pelagomonas_calceolata.AAC.2
MKLLGYEDFKSLKITQFGADGMEWRGLGALVDLWTRKGRQLHAGVGKSQLLPSARQRYLHQQRQTFNNTIIGEATITYYFSSNFWMLSLKPVELLTLFVVLQKEVKERVNPGDNECLDCREQQTTLFSGDAWCMRVITVLRQS